MGLQLSKIRTAYPSLGKSKSRLRMWDDAPRDTDGKKWRRLWRRRGFVLETR